VRVREPVSPQLIERCRVMFAVRIASVMLYQWQASR
jgi:hypothetical protein